MLCCALLCCAQAEHKRLLLAALTKSLSVVLPFLERTLEQSFSAASDASRAGQQETAQQHVAALQAALGAEGGKRRGRGCVHWVRGGGEVSTLWGGPRWGGLQEVHVPRCTAVSPSSKQALRCCACHPSMKLRAVRAALLPGAVATYAEWAPLTWLQQSGLIGACGFLLGTLDFRESACDVLRLIAGVLGWGLLCVGGSVEQCAAVARHATVVESKALHLVRDEGGV